MYATIVRSKISGLWVELGKQNYAPVVDNAVDDVRFEFVGPPPVGATFTGKEQFAAWFERLFALFPDMRLTARQIDVGGWPWHTVGIVRFDVDATLADGSAYHNDGVQRLVIRWGRLVDDTVWEDTDKLARAVAVQTAAT